VYGPAFSRDGKFLVTGGADGIVRRIATSDGTTTALRGHQGVVWRIVTSPDNRSFFSQATDGTVQVWSPEGQTSIREFSKHGNVEDAEYIEGGRRIASVGDDGQVLAWSPSGTDVSVLFQHPRRLPLKTIESLPDRGAVAVGDAQGAVWEIPLQGSPRQIRSAEDHVITVLRASPDGGLLGVGTSAGVATIYETANDRVIHEATLEGGIHQIQFDPHNRDLLIASKDGQVRVVTLSVRPRVQWQALAIDALNMAYSRNGEMIAFLCRDGGSWFYSFSADRWVHGRDHAADVPWGTFSHDGARLVSTDRGGVVVVRDMAKTFSGSER
jgi:WD40 repeat protein